MTTSLNSIFLPSHLKGWTTTSTLYGAEAECRNWCILIKYSDTQPKPYFFKIHLNIEHYYFDAYQWGIVYLWSSRINSPSTTKIHQVCFLVFEEKSPFINPHQITRMLAHINYPYISLSPKVGAFTLRFLFIHLPCDTGHENINFSVTPNWDRIEEC